MNKQTYNRELEKAKTLIFEAEKILDDIRHDEGVPLEIRKAITPILQNDTKNAMDNITDLYIDSIKKRKNKNN